jgi:hypothetical protein
MTGTRIGAIGPALVILLLVGRVAAAQTASGVIAGTVTDHQRGVLPGVTLTVRSADTGAVRSAVSDEAGRYRVAGLLPGDYDLRADLEGFGSLTVKSLTVTVGLELKHDLVLGIQGLQEAVTVRGQAPIVDTSKSEVASVITEAQINALPVEGRSAVTLSLLLPGTSTDAVRAQRPGATVGLGGLSTAGTNYIVDGMNNMISRAGDAREDVPQSAIQEFKVIVSQAPAEYGGRVGGVVNVVTKSGSNLFGGQAFEYFRNKDLNRVDLYTQQSHDQQGTPIPDFQRNQYGGAFGGPAVANKLYFYTSLERTDESGVLHGEYRQAAGLRSARRRISGWIGGHGLLRASRPSGQPDPARLLPLFQAGRDSLQLRGRYRRCLQRNGHRDARFLLHRQSQLGAIAAPAERVHHHVWRVVPEQHLE